MTPLVRRYIKTSFVFLLAGLLLGGWIIAAEFLVGRYPPRLFITAHVHLLLVGFMLMMVMGVATWMFPRPAKDDTRYRPELAEAVYWVMTVSTALRAAAELLGGALARPRAPAARSPPAVSASSAARLPLRRQHVASRAHAPRRSPALIPAACPLLRHL